MTTNISPSHLPKGTVIKTGLYEVGDDGELHMSFKSDSDNPDIKAAEFTVDYVKICNTMTGRIAIVVTTTPEKEGGRISESGFYSFHIDHVSKILRRGNKTDIRYDNVTKISQAENISKCIYKGYQLSTVLGRMFDQRQPYNIFDTEKALVCAMRSGIFTLIRDTDAKYAGDKVLSTRLYRVNKQRLKRWVKQNINRFIMSAADIKKNEQEINDWLYENALDDFDSSYT